MPALGDSADNYLSVVSEMGSATDAFRVHDSLTDLVSAALQTGGARVARAPGAFDLMVNRYAETGMRDDLAIEVKLEIPDASGLREFAGLLAASLREEEDIQRLLVLYADGPRSDRLRIEFDPGPLRFQRLDEFFERLRVDSPVDAIAKIEQEGHAVHRVVGEIVGVDPTPLIQPLDDVSPAVPVDVDMSVTSGDHVLFTYNLPVDDATMTAVVTTFTGPPPDLPSKRISAWVGDPGDAQPVLLHGQQYRLGFKVGDPMDDSLLDGPEADIPLSDIPERGLDTSWVVHGGHLTFDTIPGSGVELARGDQSTVVFDLHIPQQGDSATVTVGFTPREAAVARLDIVLRAGDRIYRQLTAELAIGEPAHELEVKADTPYIRGDSILGLPPQEPSYLEIALWPGNRAYVSGRLPSGERPFGSVDWTLEAQDVDTLFSSIRSAADQLRQQHGAYLDDMHPEDLDRRLASFRPGGEWPALPDGADEAHESAWATVRASDELKKLAEAGHAAYDVIFPTGTELRRWIDALPLGARLSINTTEAGSGRPADVPWGLLYLPVLGGDIDSMGFLGLRFRLASFAYKPASPANVFLGDPNDVTRALCFFWGTEEATANETQRQRETLGAAPGTVLVPSVGAADPKATLLSYLSSPGSAAPATLYFFCHYGRIPPDDQGFRFGNDNEAPSVVTTLNLGAFEARGAPLVFANACATGAEDAYHVSQIKRHFLTHGGWAYLGTEIKVPTILASRLATAFFALFQPKVGALPLTAGEALAQTRLFLWTQYRNIGGLFYTYVNEPDLVLAAAPTSP
jgi:hypothetical protein